MDEVATAKKSSLEPVENFAQGIVSAIPIRQFKDWISAYFHPAETLAAQTSKSASASAVHFALIGLVGALLGLVGLAIGMALVPSKAMTALFAAPFIVIGYPILVIIAGFIGSAVYWIFAKILGGRGSFSEQTCGLALVMGGAFLLALPFQLLGIIPLLGILFSLVAAVIGLYGFYSEYRVIKAVHSLSSLRAAAVVLLLPLLAVILIGAIGLVALVGLAAR